MFTGYYFQIIAQEKLAKALSDAGTDRFRLADDLARLLVSHTYLGQLDVNPIGGVPGGKGALKQCEFWAQKIEARGSGPVQVRVEGKSEAAGGDSGTRHLWNAPRDGRMGACRFASSMLAVCAHC